MVYNTLFMDINELIAIVKKLQTQINIENIKIEDKSFLHKNHKESERKISFK